MNISTIVGLKNNLEYTKYFYTKFRQHYPSNELCFVSYGSNDGTNEWLEDISKTDLYVKSYSSNTSLSLSATYNKGVTLATKKYIVFCHNDIVIAKNFLENIYKHLDKNEVICYTVVEPPVFENEHPGKIVKDFGTNIENFQEKLFELFCDNEQQLKANETINGSSFFIALCKDMFLGMGGLDTLFNPMFCEDEDMIRRLELMGKTIKTSLDALCYHFVSKTSRFSTDYENNSKEIEYQSNRNFIRKWGSTVRCPYYTKSLVVKNCDLSLLELLEPWCNNIYIEKDKINIYTEYLSTEQAYTKIDLSKKLHTFQNNNLLSEDSIIISLDGSKMNERSFSAMHQIPNIVKNNNKTGIFKLDIYTIQVQNLLEHQNHLISCNNDI